MKIGGEVGLAKALRQLLIAERHIAEQEIVLRRYLDNHCTQADQEGMSALCECRICRDCRKIIGWFP